jgi:hypothetical protein
MSWSSRVNTVAGFISTLPVAPSIEDTTVCFTVGVAQRNSPVRRSSV